MRYLQPFFLMILPRITSALEGKTDNTLGCSVLEKQESTQTPEYELSVPTYPQNRSCSRLVAVSIFLLVPAESCSGVFQKHLPNPDTLAGDHPRS